MGECRILRQGIEAIHACIPSGPTSILARMAKNGVRDSNAHAAQTSPVVYSENSTDKANLAAHLYYSRAMSFMDAMLQAGYAESTARNGPMRCFEESPGLREAFRIASETCFRPDYLKKQAIQRLAVEMNDYRNGDGIRAIEVLGKLKEFDWFVKGQDSNVGILIDIAPEEKKQENPCINAIFDTQ